MSLTQSEKATKYDGLAAALWWQVKQHPEDSFFAKTLIEIHKIPDPEPKPCPHKFQKAGYQGPSTVFVCELCGEEELISFQE